MSRCNFIADATDPRIKRCPHCKLKIVTDDPPERCYSDCGGQPGAGHHLKAMFASAGIASDGKCGCEELAAMMDRKGPDWCEQNIDMILCRLRENAARRGLLFIEWGARLLVRRAISKARLSE